MTLVIMPVQVLVLILTIVLGVHSQDSSSSREQTYSPESNFNIYPRSQVAGVNESVSFQCQSSDPNAVILWKIDNMIITPGTSRPLGITFDTILNSTVDILIVKALPMYNGSEITCIAFIPDEHDMPEHSRPATLQGNGYVYCMVLYDIIMGACYSYSRRRNWYHR